MASLLSVTIGVKKNDRVYRMQRIDHYGNRIFCVMGTPLGYHISVHDADSEHPHGIIHARVPRGTFTVWPGGVDVGNTTGEIPIPPFSAITEPIPVLGSAISVSRVDERFLYSAKEIKVGRQTESVVLDVDLISDRFVGWFILLLQPRDWVGTERWYRLHFANLPGWRLESVHTWARAEPWLGVGFVSAPSED